MVLLYGFLKNSFVKYYSGLNATAIISQSTHVVSLSY